MVKDADNLPSMMNNPVVKETQTAGRLFATIFQHVKRPDPS